MPKNEVLMYSNKETANTNDMTLRNWVPIALDVAVKQDS
jgi:hypothetical protein